MAKRPSISGTEHTVLQAVWNSGGGTVREIASYLEQIGKTWAYTTVQTLLNRLEAKGCVVRDTSRAAHVYQSKVSREGLLNQRLHDLADQFCSGASSPLVTALVSNHKFTTKEIAEFRRLLDEAEQTAKGKRAHKRTGTDKGAAR
jgi:predicted transcriptional regulator